MTTPPAPGDDADAPADAAADAAADVTDAAPGTTSADAAALAVEVLGGTPAGLRRGPSPAELLHGRLRRVVRRFDAGADRVVDVGRGRHPLLDRAFYGASELGDFSLLWHLIGATKGLRSDRDARGAVRLSVALGLESLLVNGLIKQLFRRTRPVWGEGERPLHLRRPRSSSFPSGHASSGFMAAALLADGDPAWRPVYLVAAVVATSRVYVRIHHASDVVAGALLGLLLGRAVVRAAPLPRRLRRTPGRSRPARRFPSS